jgi:hypothetical protein
VVPPSWQEPVDPIGWIVRQAREDIREPSLRIDVVEIGGLDEGVDSGGASPAAYVTRATGSCRGALR